MSWKRRPALTLLCTRACSVNAMALHSNDFRSIGTAKVANQLSEFLLNHNSESKIASPFHLAHGVPFMVFHNTVKTIFPSGAL